MYCRKCGEPNADTASRCARCGEALQQVAPTMVIPNYLAQSILVTLFCCLPVGIPAIVFATQVNGKIASGDIPSAMTASKQAKMWSWISFGVGIAWGLIYAIFVVVTMVSSH